MMYYHPLKFAERWPHDAMCAVCNRPFCQAERRAFDAPDQTCSRVCAKKDGFTRDAADEHGKMSETFIQVKPPHLKNSSYLDLTFPDMIVIDGSFSVDEARLLRDWLNSILPDAAGDAQ